MSCSIAAVQASEWEEFVEEDGVTLPRQRQLRDVYKYHGVELLDLVRQLLHPDPAKRLTPQQALCHPYMHRQAVTLKVRKQRLMRACAAGPVSCCCSLPLPRARLASRRCATLGAQVGRLQVSEPGLTHLLLLDL